MQRAGHPAHLAAVEKPECKSNTTHANNESSDFEAHGHHPARIIPSSESSRRFG